MANLKEEPKDLYKIMSAWRNEIDADYARYKIKDTIERKRYDLAAYYISRFHILQQDIKDMKGN